MFKSIEYKLVVYLILLIISIVSATYFFVMREETNIVWAALSVMAALFAISRLYKHYMKFNQNIVFLLNAMENGDYSFHFSENKMSKREKELNAMLNRIKDILGKARKEIIENEKFLSLIIESVSTGIIIVESNNGIRIANRAAMELLGMKVFTHLNQLSPINKDFPEIFKNMGVQDRIQIKIPNERENMLVSLRLSKIKLKSGDLRIITLNNIGSELEAQEMESWIRLIRVMTHEIMNSIAPITSLTETMMSIHQKQDKTDQALRGNTIEAFETINSTAKGLLSFVESYRKFTGIAKPELQKLDLRIFIKRVLNLVSSEIALKNIKLNLILSDSELKVEADESQITQVLVNLIKNGIEAIDPMEIGEIAIETFTGDGETGILITNNGRPIPEDIIPHIFIPFFTTKESGTGIGLSMSRYIMRLHGGNLKYYNSNGKTTFSMVFNS